MIIRDNLADGGAGSPNAWWGAGNTPAAQPTIGAAESWTVEAVINFQSTTGTEAILANNGGGSEWWWRANGGNTLQCLFADADTTTGGIAHTVPGGFDSGWHHVALVFDRGAEEVRTYYDYALIGTTPFVNADYGAIGSPTRDLEIGQFDGSSSRDFDGFLDHLRISDEVLAPGSFIGGATTLPEIDDFYAIDDSVTAGAPVTLEWQVEDAVSLSISGVGPVVGTSVVVNPTETTTYTLTATNNIGSVTADVTVTVGVAPTISSFAASPTGIAPGGSATLNWSVSDADTLAIDQGVGDVTGLNSTTVMPAATQSYTLTASNEFGASSADVEVLVGEAPRVFSFGAEVGAVAPGGSAELTWDTGGATTLTLNPGNTDVTAATAATVAPGVYTLTATNAFGSTSAEFTLLAGHPLLTEFSAANSGLVVDEDGDSPDWIELSNPFGVPLAIGGYYLTDDALLLGKWRIPDGVTLPAGGALLVFASGKDRAVADAELHANFSLDAGGEYLALVAPDGSTVIADFGAEYPRQMENVSYGIEETLATTALVAEGAAGDLLVPGDASDLATDWDQQAFTPAAPWMTVTSGIGYDSGPSSLAAAHKLHLDAGAGAFADNGVTPAGDLDPVVEWHDQSGLGNHALAQSATDATVFVANAINGHPAMRFTGSDGSDFFEIAGLTPATGDDLTVLVVAQPNPTGWPATGSALKALVGAGNPANGGGKFLITALRGDPGALGMSGHGYELFPYDEFTASDFDDGAAHLAELVVSGSGNKELSASFDGAPAFTAPGATPAPATGTVQVGGHSSNPSRRFHGDVAEVIVFDAVLDPADHARVRDYLLEKYGIGPGTGEGSPFGQTDFARCITSDVGPAMEGVSSSAFLRLPFAASGGAGFDRLVLKMKYDDGFIAYLNGVEVTRRNAPAASAWDSVASASRPDSAAVAFESIDISWALGELAVGPNVLAIHGMNEEAGDDDFLVVHVLEASTVTTREAFFAVPTPAAPNGMGFSGFVADTKFLPDRGFYAGDIDVAITTATAGAEIYYTTDGSVPTPSNGTLYTAPVGVDTTTTLRAAAFLPGFVPTNTDTHTYIFAADVPGQPADPAGFPADWGTHIQNPGNGQPFLAIADYAVDPGVATPAELQDALTCLPAVSIVMERDDLFDAGSGIYSNPMQQGEAWERPTSIEFIHPDGAPGFQEDAGLRIQGAAARRPWTTPKHSFRVLFKSEYGVGKLEHPLFPGSDVDRFNTLVLRAGFNDAWTISAAAQSENALYISDQWARDSQRAMGQPAAPGRFVNLFVDGLYWGVYNLHERPDASFQSEHQGGADDAWDVVNHPDAQIVDGTRDAWDALYAKVNANPLDYAGVLEDLDVVSLIDYMLLNFYNGTNDWLPNNWYAAARTGAMGGYQFFVWDAEMGFNSVNHTGKNNANTPSRIFSELRDSDEFLILFADRAQRALFNDGALTTANSQARLQALADQIGCAIRAESARWGDVRRTPAYTYESDWLPEFDQTMSFLANRGDVLLGQLITAGLFPDVEAPIFSQHGGQVPVDFELSMFTDGTTYYTTDGSDPREVGGAVGGSAIEYDDGAPPQLTESGLVRARTLVAGEWSAITEATFVVGTPADASNLVISEFSYRPAAATAAEDPGDIYGRKDFEFVELMNIGDTTIELADVAFTAGIGFEFNDATETQLAPGARLVLAADAAAFSARYSGVTPVGTFNGSLSNDGEQLILTAADGSVIRDFTYNDQTPWPTAADGDGYSLVLVAPESNPDHSLASSWCPSASLGGTPGGDDSVPFVGQPTPEALLEYALAGGGISASASGLAYTIDLTAKDVRVEVEISTDLENWDADPALLEIGSRTHNGDGTETISWRPTDEDPRVFMRLRVAL